MKTKILGIALCLVMAPGLSLAADSARSQLQHFVSQVKSASGQFEQSTDSASGNADKGHAQRSEQTGTFAFERPGKFRWAVEKPYAQLIVSDGQAVYQYDPDLEQVTQRRADDAVGASPAAVLFGSGSLDDAFHVQDEPARDGLQWLRAEPKSPDAGFMHVDIGFADGLPVRLDLLDAFGQTSHIRLKRIKTNPDLPEKTFRFDMPEGADLVRLD